MTHKHTPSKVYVIGEVTCREYAHLDILLRTHNGMTDAECMSTGEYVNQTFLSVDTALHCAITTLEVGQ